MAPARLTTEHYKLTIPLTTQLRIVVCLKIKSEGDLGECVARNASIGASSLPIVALILFYHVAARPSSNVDNPRKAFASEIYEQFLCVVNASKNASTSKFKSPLNREVQLTKNLETSITILVVLGGFLSLVVVIFCISLLNYFGAKIIPDEMTASRLSLFSSGGIFFVFFDAIK